MSKLKEFTTTSARPLPVIILADVSGSMSQDGKIDALNGALTEMLDAFADEDSQMVEIHVAVVTFGGSASLYVPLQPCRDVTWSAMVASGNTPLGAALTIVTDLLEDRQQVPSRAYRPSVVLVSDGQPNDAWQEPLGRFLGSERASKAQRFALGIGADADLEILRKFLADPEGRVMEAHEARGIRQFFRWVTMSVTARSRSTAPEKLVSVDPLDLDDYGEG
jgi:uncharacterized protein YegL